MRRGALFIVASLSLAGCAKQRMAWRLSSGSTVLTPPAQRVVVAAGKAPCADPPGLRVVRHGKSLRIDADAALLAAKPAGWLRRWAAEMETSGCLPEGSASGVAEAVADSVALDPARAYALLHKSDRESGYVDLSPVNRLELTAPLLREGTDPNAPLIESAKTTGAGTQLTIEMKTSAALVGFEVVRYTMRGGRVAVLGSERHIDGVTQKSAAATKEYLPVVQGASFYRLVYRARVTEQTVAELLVAARSTNEMEALTAQVAAQGDCPAGAGNRCVAIPGRVALNPLIAVEVNGAEVALGREATVAGALRAAGIPDSAAPVDSLRVWKPWRGRLIPVSFAPGARDVLALRLLGGERIACAN